MHVSECCERQVDEALRFAIEDLGPTAADDSQLRDELERVMALFAFRSDQVLVCRDMMS